MDNYKNKYCLCVIYSMGCRPMVTILIDRPHSV